MLSYLYYVSFFKLNKKNVFLGEYSVDMILTRTPEDDGKYPIKMKSNYMAKHHHQFYVSGNTVFGLTSQRHSLPMYLQVSVHVVKPRKAKPFLYANFTKATEL